MQANHFTWAHPRWFAVKLGLVAFLLLPLEGMHAYINHVWVARGLAQTAEPPYSQDLRRGLGIDGILRTLGAVLLSVALPLMVWLSVRRPF